MKIIYLYIAALLIHPCPFCWVGEAVINYIGDTSVSRTCCVSDCSCEFDTHSHGCQHERNHDDKQECPCQCHATDITFAQIVPPINLRGIATDLCNSVHTGCYCLENNIITNDKNVPGPPRLVVPLQI